LCSRRRHAVLFGTLVSDPLLDVAFHADNPSADLERRRPFAPVAEIPECVERGASPLGDLLECEDAVVHPQAGPKDPQHHSSTMFVPFTKRPLSLGSRLTLPV
jgi:hypothetical protein